MNNGYMVLISHPSETDRLSLSLVVMPYENELETLQSLVGGFIEALPSPTYFPFSSLQVIGWCNDEGKLMGLSPTLPVVFQGRIVDMVVGDIVVQVSNGPDTLGFTVDELMQFLLEVISWYRRLGVFLDVNFRDCDTEVIQAYDRKF